MQADLFPTPPAPRLDVARFADWPFPGLTALETAQATMAQSEEFVAVIADTIRTGPATATAHQVLAAIPQKWREALGRFCHASLTESQGQQHGINVKRVKEDGGGYHLEYSTMGVNR